MQDTEALLKQLEEDRLAVKEVQDIVSQEESIMAKETQLVQDYADVSSDWPCSSLNAKAKLNSDKINTALTVDVRLRVLNHTCQYYFLIHTFARITVKLLN